eukprot:TRINITY_DN2920_c0_g1_i2.p2 TRINITY_DN2920_c0_g1~~TRINITY_DN2920_c0_g1_i2.p2  ORF type:complete len:309 (-),score=42.28 TRINITY_DN2920_c0_g1_i2:660-1586(-)
MSFILSSLCPTHGNSKGCPCRRLTTRASIFTAAELGDEQRVQQLLQADCSKADCVDMYGYTPLHFASQHGRLNVMRLLLEAGARVDGLPKDQGGCGATPLHRAAFRGETEAVRLLLAAGASVSAQDASYGDLRTPLHKAACEGHMDAARLLLAAGANAYAPDANGLTPLDVCPATAQAELRHLIAACQPSAASSSAACDAARQQATNSCQNSSKSVGATTSRQVGETAVPPLPAAAETQAAMLVAVTGVASLLVFQLQLAMEALLSRPLDVKWSRPLICCYSDKSWLLAGALHRTQHCCWQHSVGKLQ